MRIASAVGIGFGLSMLAGNIGVMAQANLSAFHGAWLSGSGDCADVYSSAGKETSFKKPIDIFAPAFIISGNRLRTPQATCRIKSVSAAGERQRLVLGCANAVSGSEVRVLMSVQPDGTLKRYFNEQDTMGTQYRRCSR